MLLIYSTGLRDVNNCACVCVDCARRRHLTKRRASLRKASKSTNWKWL